MTKFQRDIESAKSGDEIEVITRRRAEIKKLTDEGKRCKNGFKVKCIAQDVARLTKELEFIESMF